MSDKNQNPVSEVTTSEEHAIRVEKVKKMREAGIEPWPTNRPTTVHCKQLHDAFKDDEDMPENSVAGRIVALRGHGKTVFLTIQDFTGRIQVYIRKDAIGDQEFENFKHFFDLGDILWVHGTTFKTKTGEVTVRAQEIMMLAKCLHPLPEKFHGLTDIEIKYRQRYLDLISNPESRERFKTRSKIVKSLRDYLETHEFMEVETPMLHPIPGGAAAKPFVTHHNALHSDFYLRIAPELYLKRLVVGGFERVYEINRSFRNEGVSTRHNPEFTMLEYYMANQDYHFAMNFLENMIKNVIAQSCSSDQLSFGDKELDLGAPFKRISMRDAVLHYTTYGEKDLSGQNIDATLKDAGIELDNNDVAWGYKLVALFEELVEGKLIQPTFITDFPIEVSPLSKRDGNDSNIAARFELYIAGMELSNGFNELNDPFDQADRFHEQAKSRSAGDDEAHYYDADYVQALEYGMPSTVGVGIGIDRLTMLLTNATSIKDVILFPTLKRKEQ